MCILVFSFFSKNNQKKCLKFITKPIGVSNLSEKWLSALFMTRYVVYELTDKTQQVI